MRIITASLLVVIALIALLLPAQADETGLVANYNFSEGYGTVLHDTCAVKNHGRVVGAAWVKSSCGAALDFDGSDEFIDCGDDPSGRVAGPLTLAVWLRTASNQQQTIVDRGGWSLYLDDQGIPVFQARTAKNDDWDTLRAADIVPADRWTMVAVVYDTARQQVEIYVDGKLSASKKREGTISASTADTSLGRIGGLFRSKLYLGKGLVGLMGGFRLYDRALSGDEVRRMNVDSVPDPALRPLQCRVRVTPHLFFDQQKVVVDTYLSSIRRPSGATGIEVMLMSAGKNRIIARQKLNPTQDVTHYSATFSLKGKTRGEYELKAVVTDTTGRHIAVSSGMFTFSKAPWWYNSKAGITDKVMSPWTPLVLKLANSGEPTDVECWGRTYRFDADLLPRQITVKNQPILAEPVRFAATVNGGKSEWQGGTVKVEKNTASAVVLSGESATQYLSLKVKSTIEYDGMMRFDCEIKPKMDVSLDALTLEIPLTEKYATLQYQYRDALFKAPGSVPKEGFARSFNPAIWLGNEDLGLQWFTESDRDWHVADPDRAIEVVREPGKVILRLNLVSKPIQMVVAPKSESQVGELTYTFGLEATPVKSFDKDAWDYCVSGSPSYGKEYEMVNEKWHGEPVLDFDARHGVKTICVFNWTDVLSYPGVIGPHKSQLHELVKACHQRGMQVLLYLGNQFTELAPEFPAFKEDFVNWSSPAPYSYSAYPDNYPPMRAQLAYVNCPGSRWSEFIVAGSERMLDEYRIDGFYLDGVGMAGPCYNTEHGCGYRNTDGTLGQSYPIWEARDLIRRLYTLVKSRKPDGQIDLHNASFMLAPSLAWATNRWDGETILGEDRKGNSPKPGDSMLDFLSLESFRAQFMGKQWGLPAEFLDYYVPYPYMRQFSITLLHDVFIRANNPRHVEAVYPLRRVMDEFGRKQAEWLPYWKNAAYVTAAPSGAYVSLYKHPKNGVLAVVANLSRNRETVQVHFDLAKLGLAGAVSAIDAMTKNPVQMKEGSIVLDLDTVDWKLIWLKP